jgi:hypothetical protein
VYSKDEFLQEYRIVPDLECIKSIRLPVAFVKIRVRSIHPAYYNFHSWMIAEVADPVKQASYSVRVDFVITSGYLPLWLTEACDLDIGRREYGSNKIFLG